MGSHEERRRAPRHHVDVPGDLRLSDGRRLSVRIVNLGRLGALLQVHDLEVAILEGERATLTHPTFDGDAATGPPTRTSGQVVRVNLDFEEEGVSRHLALYFDGGDAPPDA